MNQKEAPNDTPTRSSSRAKKPRKFYYTEQMVNRSETEWETEEQCGLNQPDALQMTTEEQEAMELEHEGTTIYLNILRRAGWTAQKPSARGLSSDYIFRAPNVKMEHLEEGMTKFTGYKAIAIKCRQLGMDNFKRNIAPNEDTETEEEEEEDSVAVSESEDEDDGNKKPRAILRRPVSSSASLPARNRTSGKQKVRFDSQAKKDSTLNLKRSPSVNPSRKSAQKKHKHGPKRAPSPAVELNMARSSMAVASSVHSPDATSRNIMSFSRRSINSVTPPSPPAASSAAASTVARRISTRDERRGETRPLFDRVNDVDQFFLGGPQGGPLSQRVATLVEVTGLERHESSVLIHRIVALENLQQRVLAAEQAVYGSAQTGIVRQAISILETMEQEVLVSASSNLKVLARVEQLELQVGIRRSLGI